MAARVTLPLRGDHKFSIWVRAGHFDVAEEPQPQVTPAVATCRIPAAVSINCRAARLNDSFEFLSAAQARSRRLRNDSLRRRPDLEAYPSSSRLRKFGPAVPLTQLDRYLARKELAPFLATIVIVVALLSLENVARLMDLVAGTNAPINLVTRLMVALIPEYLVVALPLASFIAPAWAFRSLALRGEWQMFAAFGRSPWRIMLAPIVIAGLASLTQLAIRMEVEPFGERTLDAIARDIRDGKFGLPIKFNEFIALDDKTTMLANPSEIGRSGIGNVFIRREDKAFFAERATAWRDDQGHLEIGLYNGLILLAQKDGRQHTLIFQYYKMNFSLQDAVLPPLTLQDKLDRMSSTALLDGWHDETGGSEKPMTAALLARASSAVLCLIMPWLAFALAVPPRRKTGGATSLLGFVVIVLFMRTSSLTESDFQIHPVFAATIHLGAWVGAIFALFRYCSTREDGAVDLVLTRLAMWLGNRVILPGSRVSTAAATPNRGSLSSLEPRNQF